MELLSSPSPQPFSPQSPQKKYLNHPLGLTLSTPSLVFFFVYLLCWLGYLVYKHYGSAKATHIFELNILMDFVLLMGSMIPASILILISTDSGLLCSLLMITQHALTFSYYSDIAISHLETMMFLKESL